MNDKAALEALVISVKHDMARGLRKEVILQSLARTISRDLFDRVRERV